jgi:hypothetical protein
VADPVPAPHWPLSQLAFVWQVAPLVPQVPTADPVPLPHELLSQSVFAWQAAPLVLQVPAVEPVPLPHVPPPTPQAAFEWHATPPLHIPV